MGIQSIDAEDDQFAYRYDTQLLIERRDTDLDEDMVSFGELKVSEDIKIAPGQGIGSSECHR